MATAVGSSIGYQSGNCDQGRKGSNYQNCPAKLTIQSYYENCFHSSAFAPKQTYYHEFEANGVSSTLPDLLPLSDKVTSISLAQPEVVSSFTENNWTLSHEKQRKNRSNSARLFSNRYQQACRKTMGSGSSVGNDPEVSKGQMKKRQTSDSNSDNGGFESCTPKPALGVKEKLRYSLDKLSLKSPFRWSSSDKLSKSTKSKSKNSRRYSDSSSAFLSTETGDRKKSDKAHSKKKSVQGLSRMVRAYPAVRCESADTEIALHAFAFDSSQNHHDYVNLSDDTRPLKLVASETSHERGLNCSDGRAQNSRNLNQYQEMSTLPSLQAWKNHDTASRAKGTWKMLKTARSKQIPIKTHASEPNFQNNYTDFSQPNEAQPPEFVYTSDFVEYPFAEPPKLAPVSGMLLLNKDAEKTIVRPTAFRPMPVSNHNSTLAIHVNNESPWRNSNNVEALTEKEAPLSRKESDCTSSASNRSDSGRHSATSIPVGIVNGSSFSCSGSEGYESARIPSSTNHSAVHDHECSVTDVLQVFSPRKLSDETLLSNLETKMRERQSQVDSLRKDIEDNQKALQNMVLEEDCDVDRAQNSNTVKSSEKTPNHIKLQRRASMHEHQMNEQHYRRLHEEQKQLHAANTELEERIKTMTEAIDAHSRKEDFLSDAHARLEENEMEVQQQRGEIALLKQQLKENRGELSQRSNELVGLKAQNRDLTSQLSFRKSENQSLQIQLQEEKKKVTDFEQNFAGANLQPDARVLTGSHSTNELGGYRVAQPAYVTNFSINPGLYGDQTSSFSFEPKTSAVNLSSPFYPGEREELYRQLQAMEHRMALQKETFKKEQQQWAEDKRKVIKYQKLLQENYVQMYKRSHVLEREVKQLKTQLQMAGVSNSSDLHLNDQATEIDQRQSLSFPMDI